MEKQTKATHRLPNRPLDLIGEHRNTGGAGVLGTRRVRYYLLFMQSMGFDSASVLLGSNIDAKRLADSAYLIDIQQCHTVIKNMIHLTGNPGIGLDVGNQAELVHLGIIGYAIATCRLVRDTFDIWARNSEPLLGIISNYDIENDPGGDVIMTFDIPTPTDPVSIFCIEELLSITRKNGRVISGVEPRTFVRMDFPYPSPSYSQRYFELFSCPIRFNAENARVVFSRDYLDLPLIMKDDELHELYMEHCEQIVARVKQSSPIATRVRNLLLSQPQQLPTLEELAETLGMSSRTVRRRLQDEGHSYQSLVRDFKIDLAREYLTNTDLAPKKIAFLLGFDNVQAFRRAFKSWTGKTPREYRFGPSSPQSSDKGPVSESRSSSS